MAPEVGKSSSLVPLNRHQVFTGAANPGDNCYSVGCLNTTAFVVYGSGTNLVILDCGLETLQIIPGSKYGNIQVECVECSSSEGMIAASYAHHIYLFKPRSTDGSSIVSINKSENVRWHEIGFFQLESFVTSLSWNPDGSQLLTAAAERIQLWKASSVDSQTDWFCSWQYKSPNAIKLIKFSPNGQYFATIGNNDSFVKIWYKQLYQIAADFKDQRCMQASTSSTAIYNYVYISHPCTVTGFSWRATSHLMPKSSVLSYLLTSCRDNKCRIWAETSDSLRRHHISLTLNCNISNAAPIQTTSQENNGLTKNQQASCSASGGYNTTGSTITEERSSLTTTATSGNHSDDNRDSDSFDEIESDTAEEERQQLEMAYGNPNRFHLVSVINPQADIPTSVGSVLNGSIPDSTQFVVHWLNNKYFHFNLQAEIIFRHLRQKLSRISSDTPPRVCSESILKKNPSTKQETVEKDNDTNEQETSLGFDTALVEEDKEKLNQKLHARSIELAPDSIDGFSEVLRKSMPHWLKEWNGSNDVVFAIHPLDGSLLVWKIESLDEHWKGRYKHPQISFASRIPNAFPASDAISCSNKLLMYRNVLSNDIEKFLKLKFEHQMSNPFILTNKNYASGLFAPNVVVLSKHSDGSLNQWEVTFDALSKYNSLQTVSHQCRVSGHRFQMIDVQNHPSLPLLLTVSHHNVPKMKITNVKSRSTKRLISQMSVLESNLEEPAIERPGVITEDLSAPHGLCSELILWRLDPVGPLSNHSGGLLELARVQSPEISAFCNTCWIPTLLPNNTLGPVSKSPSVCFVAFDGNCLRVYQSVIEAQSLLTEMAVLKGSPLKKRREMANLNIVSQQSTNQPACIIQLEEIKNSKFLQNSIVKLFHVFKLNDITSTESSSDLHSPENFSDSMFDESFVLVTIAKSLEDADSVWNIHTWVIRMSFDSSNLPMFPVNMSNIPEETLDDFRGSPKKKVHSEIRNLLTVSSQYKGSQKLPLDGANIESACVAEPEGVSKLVKHPLNRTDTLYQIITATSDNRVHFWQCSLTPNNESFDWKKWTSLYSRRNENSLVTPSVPVGVTCANFGRIALSYKIPDLKNETVTIRVDIYENESSGGAAWNLEDTVVNSGVKPPLYVQGATIEELKAGTSRHGSVVPPLAHHNAMNGAHAKPPTFGRISSFYKKTSSSKKPLSSDSERQSKKSSASGATCVKKVYLDLQENNTAPREYVHLSWVPKYDSSYLLCVCTGETVFVYASQTTAISATAASSNSKSAIAANNSAVVQKNGISGESRSRKWVPIAFVNISTSDQLSPFPLLMTCAANGILILGLMNEMQIYSQWQSKKKAADSLFGCGSTVLGKPKKGTLTDISKSLSDAKNPLNKMRKSHDSSSLHSANASLKGSMNSLNSLASQTANEKSSESSKLESEVGAAVSLRDFIDPGIFEESRSLTPMLPQYHPKQLIGLLNFGKTSRVKAILAHLVKTIVGEEAAVKAIIRGNLEEDEKHDAMRTRRATLSRSMTIQKKAPSSFSANDLNMSQIDNIPPLPLHSLVEMDNMSVSTANPLLKLKGKTGKSDNRTKNISEGADALDPDDKYASLFGFNEEKPVDSMLELDMDFFTETAGEKSREGTLVSPKPEEISVAVKSIGPTYFGAAQSRLLSQCLTKIQLPDLTRTEQMHLLAIAEVVSTISTESSDFAQGADSTLAKDTIDECGMKFVMGLKLHQYILRASGQSFAAPAQQVLDPGWYAWAHLSESEDQMLAALRPNSKWPDLRNVGVGWWVTNLNILRRLMEKVAREHFQFKKEPMDAAIFYIAMQKKNVLKGLFKSVGDQRMTNFFAKDFSSVENKRIALKNAFALNSKLRFEHAAAFFLLAGALDDAVQVCIKKLHDIQLAIVISRLYEEQLDFSQKAQEILQQHVINPVNGVISEPGIQNPRPMNSSNAEAGYPSNHNPFLRCIANWWLKNYSHALIALIEACSTDQSQNISVFNFYNYLRRHPMILRRHILKIEQMNDMSIAGQSVFLAHMTGVHDAKGEQMMNLNEVTKEERLLFFKTAAAHFTNGCPLLALEVLTILPPVRKDNLDLNSSLDVNQISVKRKPFRSGTIEEVSYGKTNGFDNFGNQGAQQQLSGNQANKLSTDTGMFDWGAPVEVNGGMSFDMNLDIDLGDVLAPLELEDESTPPVKEAQTFAVKDAPDAESKSPPDADAAKDIFAVYLKQSACLKIFVEELRTLAISFDCEESHLRGYFRLWLEKVVNLLHILCYERESVEEFHEDDFSALSSESSSNIFVFDCETNLEKSRSRRCWLKRNQQLLRIFLSYSALYGCNGGGLSAIRMELVQLLQELQQNYSRKQLSSTLPFPVALPLISACLAPVQTVVVNPFNYLEKFCKDLAKSLTSYTSPPQSTNSLRVAITLRNLCGALSSCIYQSLQDSTKVTLEEGSEDESSSCRTPHSTASHRRVGQLMANNRASFMDKTSILLASTRHRAESLNSQIISKASDWPGVKLILRLLSEHAQARNLSSEDKLKILLIESCCVVYIGVLFHALVTADPNEMLRIVAHPLNTNMFPLVAGGCVRRRSPAPGVGLPPQDAINVGKEITEAIRAESAAHVAANKHRFTLNMKLLNENASPLLAHEEQQYQYEKFSSPKLTLIDYFLSKPQLPSSMDFITYDSDDEIDLEVDNEDVDDSFLSDDDISGSEFKSSLRASWKEENTNTEHSDLNSYSWCLMRYALITFALDAMNTFLIDMGLELSELALQSATLQNLRNTICQWQNVAHTQLSLFANSSPAEDYIPRNIDYDANDHLHSSHQAHSAMGVPGGTANTTPVGGGSNRPVANDLFHADAHPFRSSHHSVRPIQRLWCYLVRQKRLENIFFYYCFPRKGDRSVAISSSQIASANKAVNSIVSPPDSSNLFTADQSDSTGGDLPENPVTVIYRDPGNEAVNAICFNNIPLTVSHSIHCLVSATPKDVTESDITDIVSPPAPSADARVFHGSKHHHMPHLSLLHRHHRGHSEPTHPTSHYHQTANNFLGIQKDNMLRRKYATHVRRLSSHPYLPFYLTGCSYGKVNLWEWGLEQVVAMFKTSNQKVTGLGFNDYGNKLGVCHETGSMHIYHTSFGSLNQTFQNPFLSLECHSKNCSGFVFIGCSSLVATVGSGLGSSSTGHTSFSAGSSLNSICLWDTLMPPKRHGNLISVYSGGEAASDGYSCVAYSPSTQSVVAGTVKGEVVLYDVRQRSVQATLSAFTSSQSQVKSIALDPLGNLLTVGSRDGDIKAFDLGTSDLIFASEGEHKRRDAIFKTGSRGVLDMQVLSSGDHLISCGSDGSVKLRKLSKWATSSTQFLV